MKIDPEIFCEYLQYRNNILFLEEKNLKKLSDEYGTPIYCYSLSEIRKKFLEFRNSVSCLNGSIFFAVKANYNPAIISFLSNLGSGADVVSVEEIKLVLKSGVKPKKIVFSGVGKTSDEIDYAVKKKIKQINVESEEEIQDIVEVLKNKKECINISLRVNPDIDASTHNKISTGRSEDKFGIPLIEIEKIYARYQNHKNININGLAIHIGSQITNIAPFEKAFKQLRSLIKCLKNKSFKIERLDLGGGIGISYGKNKTISLNLYRNLISKYFKEFELELLFEPGRFLVGSSGVLLTKIVRIKNNKNNKFLILDCGMNDLLRPSLYDANHEILPVSILNNSKKIKYDVVGPICESSDNFGKKVTLNKLDKGDLVILTATGAYGASMSSYYNCRIPANEILVKKDISFSSRKMYSIRDLYLKKKLDE